MFFCVVLFAAADVLVFRTSTVHHTIRIRHLSAMQRMNSNKSSNNGSSPVVWCWGSGASARSLSAADNAHVGDALARFKARQGDGLPLGRLADTYVLLEFNPKDHTRAAVLSAYDGSVLGSLSSRSSAGAHPVAHAALRKDVQTGVPAPVEPVAPKEPAGTKKLGPFRVRDADAKPLTSALAMGFTVANLPPNQLNPAGRDALRARARDPKCTLVQAETPSGSDAVVCRACQIGGRTASQTWWCPPGSSGSKIFKLHLCAPHLVSECSTCQQPGHGADLGKLKDTATAAVEMRRILDEAATIGAGARAS
jgi:hypothetical protein